MDTKQIVATLSKEQPMSNRRRNLTAPRTSPRWFLAVSTLAGALSLAALTPWARAVPMPGSLGAVAEKFQNQGAVTAYDAARGVITARISVVEGAAPVKGGQAPSSALKYRTFEIKVNSKPGHTYPVGKRVYTNAAFTQGMVTSLPILGTRKDKVHKSSWTMETSITISATGRIDGVTRLKSAETFRGFHGGVQVYILDKDGNIVHGTKTRPYGVPGNTKTTENWSEPVPPEAISAAAGYAIYHSYQPKGSLINDLTDIADGMEQLARIAVAAGEIGAVIAAL